MQASLFGYFFSMIAVLTAAVVLLIGLSNISTVGNGRHYPRPAIARTVAVELQRHPPVAKEASSAKDDTSPVVATAKADTKKSNITSPKFSPVSATTITAMGTLWVMPKNLGTVQAVSFSADPAHRNPPLPAAVVLRRHAQFLPVIRA
jgi:hypothetical protein